MNDAGATIVAIASPPGHSPRGIVRLSGLRAADLADAILDLQLPRQRATTSARVTLLDASGQMVLKVPAVVLIAIAPHSYTGEDTVELHTAGQPALLDRIIRTLKHLAAARDIDLRLAGPGEFTARAFLNGRLSLTEAEGVAATIAARSRSELDAATTLRRGGFGAEVQKWIERAAECLALVEAGIDFTDEEDVVPIAASTCASRLATLERELRRSLERRAGGEAIDALPWVVLTGASNAGKSSLFNALLERPRANVSDEAGTTRDMLTEPIDIQAGPSGGVRVLLVDTAGVDEADAPDDRLSVAMRAASRAAIGRAQLRVHCVSVEETVPQDSESSALLVRTKADLQPTSTARHGGQLHTSALTGMGLQQLRAAMIERLADDHRAAEVAVLRPRHEAAIERAADSIRAAITLLDTDAGPMIGAPELVAAELRQALDALGDVTGAVTPDDVLGLLFSRFCIGK